MILIAESGSSKTDWCLIDQGKLLRKVSSIGLNPYFVDANKIRDVISSTIMPILNPADPVSDIHFYGAGCSTHKLCSIVKQGLLTHFPTAGIYVYSDMIAAARALCGEGPGFVIILGTGSNSCAYAEGRIVEQTPSLGYVLGDEGSGTDLGKKLLKAYCYKELSPDLLRSFESKFELTEDLILESIYKKSQPNRFIASVVPFIAENLNDDLKKMVSDSFESFLNQHIKKYKALPKSTPLYITGSVAWVFADILQAEIQKQGFTFGKILQSPLEGLIEYHIRN
jgi:N-acetylglucosamine kinase-like BadF-type ATPase